MDIEEKATFVVEVVLIDCLMVVFVIFYLLDKFQLGNFILMLKDPSGFIWMQYSLSLLHLNCCAVLLCNFKQLCNT